MENWREQALCKHHDPVLWHPWPVGAGRGYTYRDETSKAKELENQAKAICGACPVESDCLSYALHSRQPDGIWGGMTPTERRPLEARREVRV